MRRIKGNKPLSIQVKKAQRHQQKSNDLEELDQSYNMDNTVSTGSTLLDLAISGTIKYGGGIPGGLLMEIFGPAGCGKTVMLAEIAGAIQRQGGQLEFLDPEARLNKNFVRMFGVDTSNIGYHRPDTVKELFDKARAVKPKDTSIIHGVMGDSLAALSTKEELEDKDKYGARRAKDFSTELRKYCRLLANRNILMACSNQVRDNFDAGPYGIKDRSTGGRAIEFYSSIRLRCMNPIQDTRTIKIRGKEIKKVVGVETMVQVFKNSVAAPYNTAPIYIQFDYGIDDIRQNLKFVKRMTSAKFYTVKGIKLDKSLRIAIHAVEDDGLVKRLRNQTIELWEEVQDKFRDERKPKKRYF